MGTSTAGDLGPRSILYSQGLLLVMVFRAYFPLEVYLTCNTSFLAFQRQLLLEYGGGPEKGRNVCFWWCFLRSFSTDSSGQLNVLWHYGHYRAWMAHRLVSSNRPTR